VKKLIPESGKRSYCPGVGKIRAAKIGGIFPFCKGLPWLPQRNTCMPDPAGLNTRRFPLGTPQVQWPPAHEEISASFWQAKFFDPWTWFEPSGFPSPEFFHTFWPLKVVKGEVRKEKLVLIDTHGKQIL
jgi:hypothetical protein